MLKEIQIIMPAFPGFKFSPTEEELILFYLKKKVQGLDQGVQLIPEVDHITRCHPWDLPGKAVVQSNNEWFFFSVHGRKYPTGSQSKRATEFGYWKVTGNKRNIKSGSRVIGIKRILHFHKGRAPTALKTEWLMDEYCMAEMPEEQLAVYRLRRNSEVSFDDSWEAELRRSMIVDASASSLAVDLPQTSSFEGHTSGNVTDKGVFEGYTLADECYNPFPVDSENYHQLIQDESSSSPKFQEWHDADDCFRDVINDDIIKLQRYSLPTSLHLTPSDILYNDLIMGVNFTKPSYNIMPNTAPPSQGTANRRIKFSLPEQSTGRVKYSTAVRRYGPVLVILILILFVLLFCFWFSGTNLSLAEDLSSWFKNVTKNQRS